MILCFCVFQLSQANARVMKTVMMLTTVNAMTLMLTTRKTNAAVNQAIFTTRVSTSVMSLEATTMNARFLKIANAH